jgi:hypothetical protein
MARRTERSSVNALVVYESMYGNTMQIAVAIAEGLSISMDVELFEVGAAPPDASGFDLLAVGGPTHQFGLSRKSSREQAADDADQPLISADIGIREWIGSLSEVKTGTAVTFDTSIRKPNLPGSAARGAAKRLKRLGYRVLLPGELFLVEGATGPITDGELSRAREWGEQVAAALESAEMR